MPIYDIVEAAKVTKEDTVIEVGPGLGILTQELSIHTKKVISLELDKSLLPLLTETLADCKNVEIIN
ncbi:MAG: rRNA adenine N-6-methyltransferase family protein, partial [Candidatus Gracilibacteria bacterium]